eukprot:712995_1
MITTQRKVFCCACYINVQSFFAHPSLFISNQHMYIPDLEQTFVHKNKRRNNLIQTYKKVLSNILSFPFSVMGNSTVSTSATRRRQSSLEKNTFKIAASIDFGSDGLALAFAYHNEVTIYSKWKTKKRRRATKAKTQILLNDQDDIVAFGHTAKTIYSNLTGKEKAEWKFFERFKMSLHGRDFNSSVDGDADHKSIYEDPLTAINGMQCSSEKVFVAAFQYLQDIAHEYIPKLVTMEEIHDDDIQWIITVPAMWSERAKYKMKHWIIKAGLVDAQINDQCRIVYEPDCAALAIYHDLKHDMASSSSGKDQKYILIDAGGYTVDIVCHQVVNGKTCVEETYYPTGDAWGGSLINDKYLILLHHIFGKEWMDEFKQTLPNVYIEVMDNFIDSKTTFFQDVTAATHAVVLPYEFVQFINEKCKTKDNCSSHMSIEDQLNAFCRDRDIEFVKDVFNKQELPEQSQPIFYQKKDDEEEYVCISEDHTKEEKEQKDDFTVPPQNFHGLDLSQFQDLDQLAASDDDVHDLPPVGSTNQWLSIEDENLVLHVTIWRLMFDSVIDKIVTHVDGLLQQDMVRQGCKYLYLCGGFSCSTYYQHRMEKHFGAKSKHQLMLRIPEYPTLCIVKGAAYFAITDNYITARRSKYTFGVLGMFDLQAAKEIGIDDDYIKQNKTNNGLIPNCFNVILRKNERMYAKDIKELKAMQGGKKTCFEILRSDKQNPKLYSDGIKIAELMVEHGDEESEEIVIQFHFSGTLLKVYAYPANRPYDKCEVSLKYES